MTPCAQARGFIAFKVIGHTYMSHLTKLSFAAWQEILSRLLQTRIISNIYPFLY